MSVAAEKTPLSLPRGRFLEIGPVTIVMGVVNCTPDSFFPDSRKLGPSVAVDTALRMIEDGAKIIDIGGESTRPGSVSVGAEEERRRVVPVIEGIRNRSDIALSIDTRKAETARAALEAGADIINDVTALRDDPSLAELAAEKAVPVILMHMRGTPKTMQKNPYFDDVVAEVAEELSESIRAARNAGIAREQLLIDPGIGFGKRLEDNLRLIKNIDKIRSIGYPVVLGVSRKSFIDKVLNRGVEERLPATLGVEAYAVMHGVDILRVHDVRETTDMIRMISAVHGS